MADSELLNRSLAVSEMTPGHFVTRGKGALPPIVLASPHSGRAYPAAFLADSALDLMGLRRAEDAYVDEIFADAAALGIPMLVARWGRAFIDLNRNPAELDPSMLDDPSAAGATIMTERVRAGLGVLPKLTGPNLAIYRDRIAAGEALRRIASVHAPYHRRIAGMLDAAVAANGYALLIDCHSMPPLALPSRQRPDFVIGDAAGSAAPEPIVRWIESYLRRAGYRTARNNPYSGGYTTRLHGRPKADCFAVQIEIDRTLYMDMDTLDRHHGFAAVASLMTGMVDELRIWLGERFGRPLPIAAE